jgi:hypothetical protein
MTPKIGFFRSLSSLPGKAAFRWFCVDSGEWQCHIRANCEVFHEE